MRKVAIPTTWKVCNCCELCKNPRVFMRISSGASFRNGVDVLFVGESPTENDVLLEEPLVDVSGKLFQAAIDRVTNIVKFEYVVTNSVICTPIGDNGEIGKPTNQQANECIFHIRDLINSYRPRVIIGLGNFAQGALKRNGIAHIPLRHPAYVIRNGGEGSIEYKRFCLQLLAAVHHEVPV